jgi:oligopeptide/dipeptide ABC transporter ATP-binding protein
MSAIMGLEPRAAHVTGGEVLLNGTDVLTMSEAQRRAVRGADIAMVYQDPMTSLNPVMRIGDQIAEVYAAHGRSWRDGRSRAIEVLGEVGIPRPDRAIRAYPNEFSGGMRQRVVIAMALALRPKVLIADEPTTALDVTIQQQIISLIKQLQQDNGMAVVWVTHDLGVVARAAHRVLVMYAGRRVEEATSRDLFGSPQHPYTTGLIGALPALEGPERPPLRQIPGTPPQPGRQPDGCPFHPRCAQAIAQCTTDLPLPHPRAGSDVACWVPPARWQDTEVVAVREGNL